MLGRDYNRVDAVSVPETIGTCKIASILLKE